MNAYLSDYKHFANYEHFSDREKHLPSLYLLIICFFTFSVHILLQNKNGGYHLNSSRGSAVIYLVNELTTLGSIPHKVAKKSCIVCQCIQRLLRHNIVRNLLTIIFIAFKIKTVSLHMQMNKNKKRFLKANV